jgi:hypothetical protein|tara:strand:+ start:282 stop:1136 length:855 start_codon:yes stop_codon:yes gene_type:complete
MRSILVALLLCLAALSGCFGDLFDEESESTAEICTGEEDEDGNLAESCDIEPIVIENNTESDNSTIVDEDPINNTNNSTDNESNNTSSNNTEPVDYGPSEGQQVPLITAQARSLNGTWENWSIYDLIESSWNGTPENMSNGSDHKWIMIEFVSTDCGHCWNAADDMSELHENYSENLAFLTFAVNFSSNNRFNASQEEIAAFQDITSHEGCYQESQNCDQRPGEPHNWTYVDDRDQTWMYELSVTGTPSFFIISPDGEVFWNQKESSESLYEVLERLFGPLSSE